MSIVIIASVFAGGVLSIFSPCVFPLIPVYLGILFDGTEDKNGKILGISVNPYNLLNTFLFVLGISTIFIILGFGAGGLGILFRNQTVKTVLGIVVIVIEFHQMEIIKIKSLYKQKQLQFSNKKERGQLLKSYLLGLSISTGWSPCVGPVLSSVLAIAASGSNGAVQGGILMMVYSLGFSIPFLALALSSNLLTNHFNKIKKHMLTLKRIGGVLIIIMGLLLIFGNINVLATIFS